MGAASGPVSFIKVFNTATDVIKQGGTRRGANMGVLRVDHPDIEEFVTVKNDPAELTNFNLSVAVTDAFMAACREDGAFALVNPRNAHQARKVRALALLDLIAGLRLIRSEPGLVFLDTINRANPTPHVGSVGPRRPCRAAPPALRILLPRFHQSREVRERRGCGPGKTGKPRTPRSAVPR